MELLIANVPHVKNLCKFLKVIPQKFSCCVHPCPCDYYGDSQKPCTWAAPVVTKYQKRISGSMLDRIDIHIEVPRVDYEKLSGDWLEESSALIRARVKRREIFNKYDLPIPQHVQDSVPNPTSSVCRYAHGGDQAILLVAR